MRAFTTARRWTTYLIRITTAWKHGQTARIVPTRSRSGWKRTTTHRAFTRARIEHVFGHMATTMNGCFVRTIGAARARAKIGLENLAYNFSRYTFLMRNNERRTATA